MLEALQFDFIQNALIAGVLASIICGMIGTLVVVNRIVFLSGGIAHAAYGGIGLAFYLGIPYLLGTLTFALASALLMATITLKAKHRADTMIGVIWAIGMALGIILIDLTPGYHPDLMSYLFGSILTVPPSDLWVMLVLGGLITLFMLFYYQEILALSYDEEFARTRGVPVQALYFMIIGMLAVTIVLVIQIVGLILVIALLSIPPFIAEQYAKSLWQMMLLSSFLGGVFTVTGLALSYAYDITSGASIILVAGICFFISYVFKTMQGHFTSKSDKSLDSI